MTIAHIYRDPNLCGHALTSLHSQLADFTTAQFSWAQRPDPGTYRVLNESWWVREVEYFNERGSPAGGGPEIIVLSQVGNYIVKPLIDLTELVARRVLGLVATAVATVTVAPLGLSLKTLHLCVNKAATYPLGKKAIQIWNDPNLYGHRLTQAPITIWNKVTAPLSWHLRENGTDRRTTVCLARSEGITESLRKEATEGAGSFTTLSMEDDPSAEVPVIQKGEYGLVPFELFEYAYRGVVLGPCLVVATALSPLGFASKCVDLARRAG